MNITGPGTYRTRDGRKAIVAAVNLEAAKYSKAIGWIDGKPQAWSVSGCMYSTTKCASDIVSEWREPRTKEVTVYAPSGISLRDYFAAMAIQAIVAKHPQRSVECVPNEDFDEDELGKARGAYAIADAMLAARDGA